MSKRKLFVGSSTEAADSGALRSLIDQLSQHLGSDVEVISWQNTIWSNLESALRTLTQSLTEYSYAVFLGWPDDKLEMRTRKFYCCRDNVIFEFGLFLSQLGRERTFFVAPKPGIKLPPDDLEYHILTDLRGTFFAGTYTITGTGSSLTPHFRLDSLIQTIQRLECDMHALTPVSAKTELDRQIQGAQSKVRTPGRPDAYYSGLLRNRIDYLINLKAIESNKSVQDAVQDLLLFMEYERDVCDLKQLTHVQHHEVGQWGQVWVFADSPLEFQPTSGRDFDALRKTIRDNLLNGVEYKYFLTEDGYNKSKLDMIIPSNIKETQKNKMRKQITFFLVDKKLFKTYFTLHFPKGQTNPTKVYMSALRDERRKDLLIEIADSEHIQRIRENIELLCGKDEENSKVKVKRFV
ncbi:putative nucleotide-binding protein containing TIR-like domain protein [Candidatus Methylomirabilis lanthanidiphila]|uniref:Putative nucleotide-binding protein containing TIR-like domain protein n=1 Tax=Candidatus Methylomirabilis lanthanidiphila TaxID=2211376 RepID=A0A564ZJV4_9BACT|nr:nucleotide-binding protein [Candidatus Methylomirabilis lanthanidiphila]VUZ85619.1 putative nucleotide-binding protein containing TIR-like domain protein [Candidatus Methylomirabilis lanthanidiphila]